MSLTSRINEVGSLTKKYFEQKLPNTKPFKSEWRSSGDATIVPTGQVSWTLIGTAVDYRIRYFFTNTPPDRFVARHAGKYYPHLRDSYEAFSDSLTSFIEMLNPFNRTLALSEEVELAQYCYVLALYEHIARSAAKSNAISKSVSPLSPIEQLNLCIKEDIDDLVQLGRAASEHFRPFYGERFIPNPTFARSTDVGGADADFIVGNCLMDIKTTKSPYLSTNNIYQLVGYAILDTDDRYEIKEIGFYKSRTPSIVKWDLDAAISVMSDGKQTITSLRDSFPLEAIEKPFTEEDVERDLEAIFGPLS
ncbi:MAG: hypothetical protein M0Z45_01125 [Actinomycetota bacterium]|nr:hypothetical protein [Actinomycetota bacterium]